MKNINKKSKVPFNDLSRRYKTYSSKIEKVTHRVLSSGQYILGPENINLEENFRKFFSVTDVVTVGSGTDALSLALRALNVGFGDEVITVANTCTPTIAAIRATGATPVFSDIDDDTLTISPGDIERCITSKTKAILPVHLYGFPADMKAISDIAKRHNLYVVEDCAQSFGSKIGDKYVGTFGDVGCFSFYPTKNIGAFGDGGAVISANTLTTQRVRRLRMYGEQERYVSIEEGVNSRMDELQAGLLSWGIKHLPKWNRRRLEIAELYLKYINNPSVRLPLSNKTDRKNIWHLFVVRVLNRIKFTKYLLENGVGFGIHYPRSVYEQKAYKFLNVNKKFLTITEKNSTQVVSLPLFPELTEEEVGRVIFVVNNYKE